MRELRVKDKVDIKFDGNSIKGVVSKIEYDRIKININPSEHDKAQKINELDELVIYAHTKMGLQKMTSSVIDSLNSSNIITVENNDSESFEQKRKFVRVVSNFNITLTKNDEKINCMALNISACGIAVKTEKQLEINDEVTIFFPKEIFEKDIKISGKIVKMNDLNYGIAYHNLNRHDEDLIMKYVFKKISHNE